MAWIITTDGFFSAVHDPNYCRNNQLSIRGRCKDDLVRLCHELEIDPQRIIETPEADYRYRVILDKEAFASYVARVAMEIAYSNFKNEVKHKRGDNDGFCRALGRVWGIFYDWQHSLQSNAARRTK